MIKLNMKCMSIIKKIEEIRMKYNKGTWERIWYDPERDTIVNELPVLEIYDIYILQKNGKIKHFKNLNKLQVIATRFSCYKRYIIIVQLKEKIVEVIEVNEEESKEPEAV